ncbi:MAG: hypothetical protein HYT87_03075 [Nitrospirae bacterium]|nr:hypothetical protein [Nitrospirota bacterium]
MPDSGGKRAREARKREKKRIKEERKRLRKAGLLQPGSSTSYLPDDEGSAPAEDSPEPEKKETTET